MDASSRVLHHRSAAGAAARARQAIKQLAQGKPVGLDARPLEGRLQGYMRLCVSSYRIIYKVTGKFEAPP